MIAGIKLIQVFMIRRLIKETEMQLTSKTILLILTINTVKFMYHL